jgi:hypothetical protein
VADQELFSFTRDDVVHAFRSWEVERRLHPDRFRSLADDLAQDVETSAEESTKKFLELLPVTVDIAEGSTPGEILRTLIGEAGPERFVAGAGGIVPPFSFGSGGQDGKVTVESAARKAAEALEAGNIDVAAGWTNLVRALS